MKKLLAATILAIPLLVLFIGTCMAGEPYTVTLQISWDTYTSTIVADPKAVINQFVAEARAPGNQVYDFSTGSIPDCIPSITAAGTGFCGSTIELPLDLVSGQTNIWVRGAWISGTEMLAYLSLEPPTVTDGQHFWLYDVVDIPSDIYLPVIVQGSLGRP